MSAFNWTRFVLVKGQKQKESCESFDLMRCRHEIRWRIEMHGTSVKVGEAACHSNSLRSGWGEDPSPGSTTHFYFCPKREPHIWDPISCRLLCVTTRPLSTMVWGTLLPSRRSAMACTEATPSSGR